MAKYIRNSCDKKIVTYVLLAIFILNIIIVHGPLEVIIFIGIIILFIVNDISLLNFFFLFIQANRFIKYYSGEIIAEFWIPIILIIYLINEIIHHRIKYNKNVNISIMFMICVLVSGLMGFLNNVTSIENILTGIAQYLLFFPLLFTNGHNEDDIRSYLKLTVLSTTLINISGFYELLIGKTITDLGYYGNLQILSRFNPSLGLPTLDWGMMCGLSMLIVISFENRSFIENISLLVNFVGLVLNQSRGPLLFLVVILIVMYFSKIKKHKVLMKRIGIIFVVFIAIVLLNRDNSYFRDIIQAINIRNRNIFNQESVDSRVMTWHLPEDFIISKYLFGLCPGYFISKYIIESQYIKILYELGFIALILEVFKNIFILKNIFGECSSFKKNIKIIFIYFIFEFFVIAALNSIALNFYYYYFLMIVYTKNNSESKSRVYKSDISYL